MATEYKLSYTATDINERLGRINQLSENVADLQDNINAVQENIEQVQNNVEQVQSNLEQHNISTTAHADIRTKITTVVSDLKEELLDGAATEYNTFKKLGELINNNASSIDQLTNNKQDAITGAEGQIVGFDANGNAVAQDFNPCVQSDWNQGDENALDYIKNKPFYDENINIETCVYPETDAYEGMTLYITNQGYLQIIPGQRYAVYYNGERFEQIAIQITQPLTSPSGMHLGDYIYNILGNPSKGPSGGINNGLPFAITQRSGMARPSTGFNGNQGTLSIFQVADGIQTHLLDEKFIPETIARVADVLEREILSNKLKTWNEDKSGSEDYYFSIKAMEEYNENRKYISLIDISNNLPYKVYMENGNLVSSISCIGLEMITPPNNTIYYPGDLFDPTGMVVVAKYADDSSIELDNSLFENIYVDDEVLVTLTYVEKLGIAHTLVLDFISSVLTDFNYVEGENKNVILTSWKGTLNGEPSTEMVVPDYPRIML